MDKENFPENSIIYINQGYLTVKDNRKLYFAAYYLIGQINVCTNPPEDIDNYICQYREVKIYCPHYDHVKGNFLGLYETLGSIIFRGDPEKHFLDYGYCKKNSKVAPFPIVISYSLNWAAYRLHFQMPIIFCLLGPIGASK